MCSEGPFLPWRGWFPFPAVLRSHSRRSVHPSVHRKATAHPGPWRRCSGFHWEPASERSSRGGCSVPLCCPPENGKKPSPLVNLAVNGGHSVELVPRLPERRGHPPVRGWCRWGLGRGGTPGAVSRSAGPGRTAATCPEPCRDEAGE